jgi:transmembrane sensor
VNNVVEFDVRASLERQAREWLIRLDGDAPLSGEERAALREWMSRSPAHRDELVRLAKFWNSANVLTELAVPLERAGDARGLRQQRAGLVALAASVLFASVIAGGWWWTQRLPLSANGTYGTAIGQQQAIALPDGSSIQLNTDSQVEVSYSKTLRKIRLLRGEALFSVAHEATKPFEVYASNGIVRALGTAFSVRLAGNDVNVMVTTGTVEVSEVTREAAVADASNATNAANAANAMSTRADMRHALARVTAGQAVDLHGEHAGVAVHELPATELQRRMAWHEGYLVFSGEPLSTMVEEVNRYSPVTLHIADPELESIAIGGRFRIGDLDAVLDALHENFGIQAVREDDRRILLQPLSPK